MSTMDRLSMRKCKYLETCLLREHMIYQEMLDTKQGDTETVINQMVMNEEIQARIIRQMIGELDEVLS